ncbi:hypothetical protein FRC09_006924 [Ceratobasidium sp. 395]|nr:hypothetical protein FRC09_006924 [Ceratobasidium sp. 395]
MKVPTVKYTGLGSGAQTSSVTDVWDHFDADNNPVSIEQNIVKLEFNEEPGHIDGMRITYRYFDPKTGQTKDGQVVHGTFNEDDVHHSSLALPGNEYICGAQVTYGNKGQVDQYVGRVTLWACHSEGGKAFRAGDWGEIPDQNSQTEDWHKDDKKGRLYALGARQDNAASSKGLKALCFGESQGQLTAASSLSYPPVGPVTQDTKDHYFDDLAKHGATLNTQYPIRSIECWHDKNIEGIQITYNLNTGATVTQMHGSKTSSSPVKISLKETESVVEVTGIHSDRVNLLDFKIFNSKTGMLRNTGTIGELQENFKQSTRKDICARGPLLGLAGRADNSQKEVGLHSLKFYTRVPSWKAPSNSTVAVS